MRTHAEGNVMIDTRYCAQCGSSKQHDYICFLASRAGYSRLRDVVAEYKGCSVSKAARVVVTVADASRIIDSLRAKVRSDKG
jgi:hypothetical protein